MPDLHHHKYLLTFSDPAPEGRITVKGIRLQHTHTVYDIITKPNRYKNKIIEEFKRLREIIPQERLEDGSEVKRKLVFDDRMLACLLITMRLDRYGGGIGGRSKQWWTPESLARLPRFDARGQIDPSYGHVGNFAWVYVDGLPRLLIAHGFYRSVVILGHVNFGSAVWPSRIVEMAPFSTSPSSRCTIRLLGQICRSTI